MSFTDAQLKVLRRDAEKAARVSKKEAIHFLQRIGVVDSCGSLAEPFRDTSKQRVLRKKNKNPN